jgi:hypothetical protein
MPTVAEGTVHRLWEEQLIDYRLLLQLAQEEEKAVALGDVEHLHHTQLQRSNLAASIRNRERLIQARQESLSAELGRVLEAIATTIDAVQTIDKKNRQHLEAEYDTIASMLKKHKQERTSLHQYKPSRENPPHFLNRTV